MSEIYQQSVAEQTAHHARSKTFSGSLMIPHLEHLIALSQRLHCRSALDYGAGKLVQYETNIFPHRSDGPWHFETLLGYDVFKYDPAVPGIMTPPEFGQTFDLVFVSHVLFWIPIEDLRAWVLPLIFAMANKAVFIAEDIGEEKKRILSNRDAHPRGLHAVDWIDLLLPYKRPGQEVHLHTGYRAMDGRIYGGRWVL